MNVKQIADIARDRLVTDGAYRRVFDSPDGKIILRHLARECFLYRTTFVAGDTNQSAMNEGSRRVVLSILRKANLDQKQLLDLIESELQNA